MKHKRHVYSIITLIVFCFLAAGSMDSSSKSRSKKTEESKPDNTTEYEYQFTNKHLAHERMQDVMARLNTYDCKGASADILQSIDCKFSEGRVMFEIFSDGGYRERIYRKK